MIELLTSTEFSWNGRNIVPGTELSIRGESGRFRFQKYVVTEKGDEWIDVYGGTGWRDAKGVMSLRSFTPDRIKTVHWKGKMR